mmetsp:Transcript_18620/g.27605  ORF Transcript_18620/g.27605 Transcript_18620/m.27605 type:complete len:243 (-) Transcript_18620:270-998(-)|eukprot:CAMPEP_0194229402 /NCGR_PEP_ID=MMETSP0156-20130528/43871_1 /TAXON_ID=33649 /ORGANISM="Thalassionema nitzschioides, Strain L26-B" /LENGTH=242 /DNA_ID=CAMNT_0038961951 /DNA_START=129 /DNA_END=857 /DNA_ORIENTATION=-
MIPSFCSIFTIFVSFGIRDSHAFHCLAKFASSSSCSKVSLKEHSLNEDSYDDSPPEEEDGPKVHLLKAIGGDRFGFGDSQKTSSISKLADDLSGYVLPLEKPSEWELLYNTAPDILGIRGGPLSELISIRQEIVDSKELEITLEYKPSQNIVQLTSSFLSGIQDDRLKQTVQFAYEIGSMNKVDLRIQGTRIEGSRFGNNLPSLASPSPLPFVGFSIVFNDGDLRIDRTIQGDFLYIYKRIS